MVKDIAIITLIKLLMTIDHHPFVEFLTSNPKSSHLKSHSIYFFLNHSSKTSRRSRQLLQHIKSSPYIAFERS